jgi:hypothetical protein
MSTTLRGSGVVWKGRSILQALDITNNREILVQAILKDEQPAPTVLSTRSRPPSRQSRLGSAVKNRDTFDRRRLPNVRLAPGRGARTAFRCRVIEGPAKNRFSVIAEMVAGKVCAPFGHPSRI